LGCHSKFLFTADLDDDFSAARAVEFTEENALPCAELQRPALNENLFAAADKRTFAVRIGIALGMPIARTVLGQQFPKCQKNVVRNGRVGIFIDSNRRGSVRAIDNHIAVSDTALADKRADLACNIDHLVPALSADAKFFLDNIHDKHISNLS